MSNEIIGTFSHGVLRLNIPQQNGSIALSTFTSASPEAFNKAVGALQVRVYNDNQTAMVQQEIANQESAIDKAASTVKQDLSTLASDQASIASAVAPFPKDLAQDKMNWRPRHLTSRRFWLKRTRAMTISLTETNPTAPRALSAGCRRDPRRRVGQEHPWQDEECGTAPLLSCRS